MPAHPEAIEFLATRRSRPPKLMRPPAPSRDEILALLTLATRVPDHGKLEPWRFVVLSGAGLARFSAAIRARAAETGQDADKGAGAFEQAPMTVAVVAVPRDAPKIPEIERMLSAGAVCLELLNAALASGWAACWLTGWPAYDAPFREAALGLAPGEWIAGFVHIGTSDAAPPERPRPDVPGLVTWMDG
ncbi:nitroreductase [Amaricoccus sp.]|uniref:nitroreductase family protein n=1 Tax=Amaricoccus sp. TaxID=1872485 RepID=UPI001B77F9CF|nr:nitroreductase [Amaricoccus sp.]MBP7243034.1 nitroreductase [Amaricoccus sp.]